MQPVWWNSLLLPNEAESFLIVGMLGMLPHSVCTEALAYAYWPVGLKPLKSPNESKKIDIVKWPVSLQTFEEKGEHHDSSLEL